jgi:hypothetical protein
MNEAPTDLFGTPCAAGGAKPGSPRGSAHVTHGRGATSAATPFLTLPSLADRRARLGLTSQLQPVPSTRSAATPSPRDATARRGETYTPVQAMEDVLALRHQQIFTHGHTLDADLALIERTGKRYAVAKLARQALSDAIEDMMFNRPPEQIRRRLVKSGALVLATIDVEDARNG